MARSWTPSGYRSPRAGCHGILMPISIGDLAAGCAQPNSTAADQYMQPIIIVDYRQHLRALPLTAVAQLLDNLFLRFWVRFPLILFELRVAQDDA